jgi:hypothetical protein
MHHSATGSRRAWLPSSSIRAATLAALLGAGMLAASALASSHAAGAQPQGPTIASAATNGPTGSTTTGTSSAPKGAWLTFEVNPVSLALRPLRRFAACVRRHNITGLADPKVIDGKVVLTLPRGLTAKSPQLNRAQLACRKLLPQGANTQPGTDTGPTTTRPAAESNGGPRDSQKMRRLIHTLTGIYT